MKQTIDVTTAEVAIVKEAARTLANGHGPSVA